MSIKLLILLYLSLLFAFFYFQEIFIFSPDREPDNLTRDCSFLDKYEELLPFGDDQTKFYLKNNNESKLLVFYHGGVGDLCYRKNIAKALESLDYDILLVEYKSYHNDLIEPSKESIKDDVENTITYIKNNKYKDISLFGVGLGTGIVGLHIEESKSNVNKIVLISPFDSLSNALQRKIKIIPVNFLLTNDFENEKYFKNYKGEVLIIAGDNDKNISPVLSKKLQQLIGNNAKFVLVENTKHYELIEYNNSVVRESIKEFLE